MAMSRKKTKKDLEYLTLSARVHAMETRLLTTERMERMIEARELEEAARVLSECGYGEMSEMSTYGLEQMLTQAQGDLFRDIGGSFPDSTVIDVFRSKYDYHNAKVLVKGEAMGASPEQVELMLLKSGRYQPEHLLQNFQRDDLRGCSEIFRRGVNRAREVLGATDDPQLADFMLDKTHFEELTQLAKDSGSRFLEGFVAVRTDAANLRSAVRASRLNKGQEFLRQVIMPGGSVSDRVIIAARGDELGSVFRSGTLAEAAALGGELSAPGSGPLTEFERMCDNAVMEYLETGRRVAFGEEPIIGFLYAREAELTAIRTIMSGKIAGIDGDTIRQRLRRTYV